MDLLIVIGFFALLGIGFLRLRVWADRDIARYIAEHTPPVDYRAEKRKSRVNDLTDWDYEFAALQITAYKKQKDNL